MHGWRQAWEARTGNTVVCSASVDVGCDILLFFDRNWLGWRPGEAACGRKTRSSIFLVCVSSL